MLFAETYILPNQSATFELVQSDGVTPFNSMSLRRLTKTSTRRASQVQRRAAPQQHYVVHCCCLSQDIARRKVQNRTENARARCDFFHHWRCGSLPNNQVHTGHARLHPGPVPCLRRDLLNHQDRFLVRGWATEQ